jgi:pimeloyl-ACP methyl ester carboxylesterase
VAVISVLTLVNLTSPAVATSPHANWREVRMSPITITAAGTTITWVELGAGPTLLMLNVTGSPMTEWDPDFLGALAATHRVIVFDYPGLGLSGPAPSVWKFPAAADWVADFIEQVSPGVPVDLLGWSMGGFIAQQLAIRHPSSIRRLILAGTNPGGDATVLGPLWVQEADNAANGSDATYLKTNYPRSQPAQSRGRAFIHRLEAANASGAYPDEVVPDKTYTAMVAAEDPWMRSNSNAIGLRNINIRTLVVTGAQDVITPPSNSRYLARHLPNATLRLVPNAGHSFLFQKPYAVASMIQRFLRADALRLVRPG